MFVGKDERVGLKYLYKWKENERMIKIMDKSAAEEGDLESNGEMVLRATKSQEGRKHAGGWKAYKGRSVLERCDSPDGDALLMTRMGSVTMGSQCISGGHVDAWFEEVLCGGIRDK